MTPVQLSLSLTLTWILLAVGCAAPVRAALYVDPERPMAYEEMLCCELVVLARYKSHDEQSITLDIDEVLRGDGVKKGDAVVVALKHNYVVQTRPGGWDAKTQQEDGIPRLCYKQQIINPGNLVPIQIVSDVRSPLLYFIPLANSRELKRRLQVQPHESLVGWRDALADRQPPLWFRLSQRHDPLLAREALEELAVVREPAAIEQLHAWLRGSDTLEWQNAAVAADVFAAIGDVDDDVYGPLHALLVDEPNSIRSAGIRRLAADVMARCAPQRAVSDFRRLLPSAPGEVRQAMIAALGSIKSAESLDLAVISLHDAELSDAAQVAIAKMLKVDLGGGRCDRQTAALLEQAIPRIQFLAAIPQVNDKVARSLRGRYGYFFGDDSGRIIDRQVEAARERLERRRINLDRWDVVLHERPWDATRAKELAPRIDELHEIVDAELRPARDPTPRLALALDMLLILGADGAQELLQRALDARGANVDAQWCWLLAVAVKHGHGALIDELTASARDLALTPPAERYLDHRREAFRALLASGHPRAMNEYVRLLKGPRRVERNWFGEPWIPFFMADAMSDLFFQHRPLFFECVLDLLRAPTLPERNLGVSLLINHVDWELDFEPAALAARRLEELRRIEPLIERWANLPERELRADVLRQLGVPLAGEPGDEWLPALREAVGSYHSAAARNALWMIGSLRGTAGLEALELVPAPARLSALDQELRALSALAAEPKWRPVLSLPGRSRHVLFSPDGQYVVTAEHAPQIWEAESGRLIRACERGGSFSRLAYTASGRALVSTDLTGPVQVWDAETGRLTRSLPGSYCLNVSPVDDVFVTYSQYGDDQAKLWSPNSDQPLLTVGDDRLRICDAQLSSAGHLLTVPEGGKAQLWDVKSRRLIGELDVSNVEGRYISADHARAGACFAGDGKRFAIFNGNYVELWSVDPLRRLAAWTPSPKILSRKYLDWSNSAQRIIVCVQESHINVLDENASLVYEMQVHLPRFSPDGRLIVSGNSPLRLLDPADGRLKEALTIDPLSSESHGSAIAQVSRDGKSLAVRGINEVKIWKLQ